MAELVPFALKETPALIETVFPAQKISFEAQRERKAGAGQTLTALGSYWKGRKPLILVRAIVMGSLLPRTDNAEKDLEIFEALMAFDIHGLGRRAVAQAALKPSEIASMITLHNPWDFFSFTIAKGCPLDEGDVVRWSFPFDADEQGLRLSWHRGLSDEHKAEIYSKALATLPTYEERSLLCKRPEEVEQGFLLAPVWLKVNTHLGHLGINACSTPELVEQLGILRYGHRPKVGDTFAGGGSIPFEAARVGCDVYASDLNPIACMLTWGALNIVGAPVTEREEVLAAQKIVAAKVNQEVLKLGIETNENGDRAKAYLYCLEVKCPESGWYVPLAPSWIISKTKRLIAKLVPDHKNKTFLMDIVSDASADEIKIAEKGTLQGGNLVYALGAKAYSTPIKTLRGDFRSEDGRSEHRLRKWEKNEFMPSKDDVFRERLYSIMWATRESLNKPRQEIFFTGCSEDDIAREDIVEAVVRNNIQEWQGKGLIPDMAIEPGYNTDQPVRERAWRYWHHLFSPRQLLLNALFLKYSHEIGPERLRSMVLAFAPDAIQRSAKLCVWDVFPGPGRLPKIAQVFSDQSLNAPYNWGVRAWPYLEPVFVGAADIHERQPVSGMLELRSEPACVLDTICDLFITDPPYADAVNYHEITEFFIAWLRKNPPAPFNQWTWDSRRALAIKGDGDDFRRGMIDAYKAMADHMPANGMQCVMFTHQDTGVWSDMVGIFWSAGLQVIAAWYIATETSSGKVGAFVQGTVTLMLKKRPSGAKPGFKQRILPAVRNEVQAQIEQMMHLNNEVKEKMGESVFNDSDLQMAGYAAALKVLTSYTSIGGEDVTAFALRPRRPGEVTVVDEIVQQASEAANSILVPEGLSAQTWQAIDGVQRFYLRMMDMETTGASKLDNYQNFSKAFRVADYTKVMATMTANAARLKGVTDFSSRDLTDSTEIGPTPLGCLIVGLQQLIGETEPQVVIGQLQEDLVDFMELRPVLIDLVEFLARKSSQEPVRGAAEVLAGRLRNQRALGQN